MMAIPRLIVKYYDLVRFLSKPLPLPLLDLLDMKDLILDTSYTHSCKRAFAS